MAYTPTRAQVAAHSSAILAVSTRGGDHRDHTTGSAVAWAAAAADHALGVALHAAAVPPPRKAGKINPLKGMIPAHSVPQLGNGVGNKNSRPSSDVNNAGVSTQPAEIFEADPSVAIRRTWEAGGSTVEPTDVARLRNKDGGGTETMND